MFNVKRLLTRLASLLDEEASLRAPRDHDRFSPGGNRVTWGHLHCEGLPTGSMRVKITDAAEVGRGARLGFYGVGAAATEVKMLGPGAKETAIADIDLKMR